MANKSNSVCVFVVCVCVCLCVCVCVCLCVCLCVRACEWTCLQQTISSHYRQQVFLVRHSRIADWLVVYVTAIQSPTGGPVARLAAPIGDPGVGDCESATNKLYM